MAAGISRNRCGQKTGSGCCRCLRVYGRPRYRRESRGNYMEQKYDRAEEILLFMQPHMEERFQESVGRIRKLREEWGNEMWAVLRLNG